MSRSRPTEIPQDSNAGRGADRPAQRGERRFLAGPLRRREEFFRVLRIAAEFIRGFRAFHFLPPAVTVFGSARFSESDPEYATARELGRRLAEEGFTVMTGGGPGIMEGANRGAHEAGGHSVGCNIALPQEQEPNPYLHRFVEFRYFFVRKVMLVKYSCAFVALPGGFGTMDELFELLTLAQTGKILEFPIALIGSDYWRPLVDFLRERMISRGTIHESDLALLTIGDDVEEVVARIRAAASERFGIEPRPLLEPIAILGERARAAEARKAR